MRAYDELARVISFQVLGARYLIKTGYTAVVAITSIVKIVRMIGGIDNGMVATNLFSNSLVHEHRDKNENRKCL